MKKLEFWFAFALACFKAWGECVEKHGNPFAKVEEKEAADIPPSAAAYPSTEK